MKIYSDTGYGNGIVFVTPGADHPETSDWVQEEAVDGRLVRRPIQFTVRFVAGMAEVDANLGRYMVKQGLARTSPVMLLQPPTLRAYDDLEIKYAKPIPVGRSLADVLAGRGA